MTPVVLDALVRGVVAVILLGATNFITYSLCRVRIRSLEGALTAKYALFGGIGMIIPVGATTEQNMFPGDTLAVKFTTPVREVSVAVVDHAARVQVVAVG